MTRPLLVVALVVSLAGLGAGPARAQGTPPAQPSAQPPAPAGQAPAAPAAARAPRTPSGGGGGRPVNVTVTATDGAGLGVSGVRVTVNGPVTRDGTTVSDGSFHAIGLKPGDYRFRFEHERFITLERLVTVRGGQPTDVDVMLTKAPEKSKEPPPPPPPAPEARASAPLPATSFDVTSYLEKEYLKSGANRVKSIACSTSDSVSLVQTTTSYASAAGKRQLVLVAIAGQGRVNVGTKSALIDSRSGSTVTVPENTGFEAAREGKSTLVFVLVEIGKGCD